MRRLAALLLLLVVAAGCAGSGEHDHPRDVEAPAGDPHDEHAGHADEHAAFAVDDFLDHGVTLATVAPGTVDAGIALPGEVRANADRLAHLSPRFAGLVREVRKRAGDSVRAGEVLAVIETASLATYELTAAFAGTILDRHVAPGEMAGPDTPAFIVADLATVWVEVAVVQRALRLVRPGAPVRITASHGAEADAAVEWVSPTVDPATRTALARIVLPNPDGAWRPGVFVTATIFDPVDAALVVPRTAIQIVDGAPALFVVEDDRFVHHPIRLGRTGRTRAEVLGGVAAGARCADAGSFLVKAELEKSAAGHEH